MKFFTFVILINLAILAKCSDVDIYYVEHSIDTNDFQEIGSLNLRTIRQNQNQAQYQSYNSMNDQLHESDQPKFHNIQFSTPIETSLIDELAKNEIRNALELSNQAVYRVRLCRKVPEVDCSVASFIYLKKVAESQYRINLTLNTGNYIFY